MELFLIIGNNDVLDHDNKRRLNQSQVESEQLPDR